MALYLNPKPEKEIKKEQNGEKNLGSGGVGESGGMTGLFESIGGGGRGGIAAPRERSGRAASSGARLLILMSKNIISKR